MPPSFVELVRQVCWVDHGDGGAEVALVRGTRQGDPLFPCFSPSPWTRCNGSIWGRWLPLACGSSDERKTHQAFANDVMALVGSVGDRVAAFAAHGDVLRRAQMALSLRKKLVAAKVCKRLSQMDVWPCPSWLVPVQVARPSPLFPSHPPPPVFCSGE